jgi:hypothetical protein
MSAIAEKRNPPRQPASRVTMPNLLNCARTVILR